MGGKEVETRELAGNLWASQVVLAVQRQKHERQFQQSGRWTDSAKLFSDFHICDTHTHTELCTHWMNEWVSDWMIELNRYLYLLPWCYQNSMECELDTTAVGRESCWSCRLESGMTRVMHYTIKGRTAVCNDPDCLVTRLLVAVSRSLAQEYREAERLLWHRSGWSGCWLRMRANFVWCVDVCSGRLEIAVCLLLQMSLAQSCNISSQIDFVVEAVGLNLWIAAFEIWHICPLKVNFFFSRTRQGYALVIKDIFIFI